MRSVSHIGVQRVSTPVLELLGDAGAVEGGHLAEHARGGHEQVDGVIALAGTCAAAALAPDALGYCVAGHRSTEPGASAALEHLGLEPLLDLGLRLGEGTGACLAVPLLVAAARVLGEMATFDGAGVTQKL